MFKLLDMTDIMLSKIKDLFKPLTVLVTFVLNIMLICALLYNPFSLFFVEGNETYGIVSAILTIVTCVLIVSLSVSSGLLLYNIAKKDRVSIYSPVLALIVLIAVLAAILYGG
ncbi:hypothetical protein SAMN05421788_1132 [Filimonas lacunae]|uniref:Uncharacterized protein n=2 Tax=Filimonas lacunae TaxID=477680 RepID=A0A1N7RET6_9BACT|nr:hypothetical protein SAMN05421788_1132 [Filimonas lacunae]